MNYKKGFVIPFIIAIVAVLAIGGVYVYKAQKAEAPTIDTNSATSTIIGGDKDEHGCLGPAGYSWCAEKNKCLRVWEEKCENNSTTTAKINQTIIYQGLSITPLKVVSDSRCSAVCIWAGTVELNVKLEGKTTAQASLTLGKPFSFEGKEITLVEVSPNPSQTKPIPIEDYRFNFLVTDKIPVVCTPKWSCGWAPCSGGYQGMTAVDSNNCGVSSVGVQIACPAIARQCSN